MSRHIVHHLTDRNSVKKKSCWKVYIIQAESGNLYTGITTDLKRRFADHQSGVRGARFFRISSPEAILYQEKKKNRSEASKREYAIKQMTREEKLQLITTYQSKIAGSKVLAIAKTKIPKREKKVVSF